MASSSFYCVHCRAKKVATITNSKLNPNGTKQLSGICPTCHGKMVTFAKKV